MTETTQNETTQEAQEIASINGKHYFKSSMSEELQMAFDQAIGINQKIAMKEEEIRDLKYARQYLIDFINDRKDEMIEYIPPAQEDTENSKEDDNE